MLDDDKAIPPASYLELIDRSAGDHMKFRGMPAPFRFYSNRDGCS